MQYSIDNGMWKEFCREIIKNNKNKNAIYEASKSAVEWSSTQIYGDIHADFTVSILFLLQMLKTKLKNDRMSIILGGTQTFAVTSLPRYLLS